MMSNYKRIDDFDCILGKEIHIYSNQNIFSGEGGKKLKNS